MAKEPEKKGMRETAKARGLGKAKPLGRTILETDSSEELERGAAEVALLETLASSQTGAYDQRFSAGGRVRQYELIRELGRGGMGRVVLARDTRLGRLVALKFLLGSDGQFNARFLLEAQTTAQASHENIVVIHEANEFEGVPYMALEYLEGESLAQYLRRGSPQPGRVIEIMLPVVRALVRAHEFGIVHRDLKPDNIFVTRSGQIKVLDFGIAKLYVNRDKEMAATGKALSQVDLYNLNDLQLTGKGAILGTMPYMSPEQWGVAPVDQRTDLWAVGIMLFEMLTGGHPLGFLTPECLQFSANDLDVPMPSVGSAASDLRPELVNLVDACLQKQVDKRIQSAAALLEALEALLPGRLGRKLLEGENPFPGLAAFQEQDADRFFGRAREVTHAAKRLQERALLGVVGLSGVGKSSMVRAGLVPALKASGQAWETFVIRPGRDPLSSLATVLLPLTNTDTTTVEGVVRGHATLIEEIREQPGYIGKVLRNWARDHETRVLLFVDQFEELYTLVATAADRNVMVAALAAIADDVESPLRVVISVRSDFLDRIGEHEVFMDILSQGLLFLQPPNRLGIREALTQPVEMLGYQYENPNVVTKMLDTLGNTAGALPLLQFAASKLWENRDQGRKLLTETSYREMGGVEGALASHANEVQLAVPPAQQRLMRLVFQRLVTPDRTRAIVDIAELRLLSEDPREIDKLIDALVQSRLLVVQSREENEQASVEIVHESLITQWPALGRWLDEDEDNAAFLSQLRTIARQWDDKGKPTGLLWRGEAMEEARQFKGRFRGELANRDRDFLDAVLALATRSTRQRRIGTLAAITLVAGAAIALLSMRSSSAKATAAQLARERVEAAVDCDCALVQFVVPKDGELLGIVRLGENSTDGIDQFRGEYLLPPGRYLARYRVGEATSAFALESRGVGEERSVRLPMAAIAGGEIFVAGGECRVGFVKPFVLTRLDEAVRIGWSDAMITAHRNGAALATSKEIQCAQELGLLAPSTYWEWTQDRELRRDEAIATGRADGLAELRHWKPESGPAELVVPIPEDPESHQAADSPLVDSLLRGLVESAATKGQDIVTVRGTQCGATQIIRDLLRLGVARGRLRILIDATADRNEAFLSTGETGAVLSATLQEEPPDPDPCTRTVFVKEQHTEALEKVEFEQASPKLLPASKAVVQKISANSDR